MTRNRQWTASEQEYRLAAPPKDRRVCECGLTADEHDMGEDWVLRAPGCEEFKEKKETPCKAQ